MKALLSKLWAFAQTLNRSKVVNGIGAFFAMAIPVLIVVGQNLPASWKVTLLIASAVGVLSRAQYIFQKVIPLLDGSSVIQTKPPTSPGQPALVSVAVDTSQVASNRGSVIPVAPMGDVPGRVFPKSDDTPVTANIRPVPRDPTA